MRCTRELSKANAPVRHDYSPIGAASGSARTYTEPRALAHERPINRGVWQWRAGRKSARAKRECAYTYIPSLYASLTCWLCARSDRLGRARRLPGDGDDGATCVCRCSARQSQPVRRPVTEPAKQARAISLPRRQSRAYPGAEDRRAIEQLGEIERAPGREREVRPETESAASWYLQPSLQLSVRLSAGCALASCRPLSSPCVRNSCAADARQRQRGHAWTVPERSAPGNVYICVRRLPITLRLHSPHARARAFLPLHFPTRLSPVLASRAHCARTRRYTSRPVGNSYRASLLRLFPKLSDSSSRPDKVNAAMASGPRWLNINNPRERSANYISLPAGVRIGVRGIPPREFADLKWQPCGRLWEYCLTLRCCKMRARERSACVTVWILNES